MDKGKKLVDNQISLFHIFLTFYKLNIYFWLLQNGKKKISVLKYWVKSSYEHIFLYSSGGDISG